MISFSTVIGISAGVGLFAMAIYTSTDNYMMFISAASAMMVIGSTIAASLISFSAGEVLHALRALLQTLMASKTTQSHLRDWVKRFMELSNAFRDGGITGLEDMVTAKEKK